MSGHSSSNGNGYKNAIMEILEWPMGAIKALQMGSYIAPAAALALPYYLYGMPTAAMGLQELAMMYGVAGVTFYVANMEKM